MPVGSISQKLTPQVKNSGMTVAMTADTVEEIDIPVGPLVCLIWFEDADGNYCRGRVGFANSDGVTPVAEDDDETLAFHPPGTDTYNVASATKMFLASPTAEAAFISWYY